MRLWSRVADEPGAWQAGALAEYADPEALLRAARALREQGYARLEAFAPYEIEGLEEALALPRSRIPWAAWAIGFAAAGGAYWLQWFCNAWDYPLAVGARPPHAALAFVPITFETLVLATATAAFAGLVLRGGLLAPWNPLQRVEGFDRASVDRFFLVVDRRDARFALEATRQDLVSTGALRVVAPVVEGAP